MKIAILGYGRMGKEIESIAKSRGHQISVIFDIDSPFTKESNLNGAEVIIDFTIAETVIDNLKTAASFGVPVVQGTTGWLDKKGDAKEIENLSMLFSPNYSIGVYLFTKIARYAAQLINSIEMYDCYLHEWHHTGKADSPSGTANNLANVLLEELDCKDHLNVETCHNKIDPRALHVTSSRVGRMPGTHQIGFDSDVDLIELKHQLHGRQGLAYGAVRAAEWLAGKKGLFTMDDFMQSITDPKSY
jgi:4-hydroxy-tetrahydrodipicolinate reductase